MPGGMAVLPILTGVQNPALRVKTKPVPKVTKAVLELLSDMEQTTIAAKGAGLAAPQVGRTERVCIAMINKNLTALVNPQIIFRSEEKEVAEEGCLSLPDVWMHVPRSLEIVLSYTDVRGKHIERRLIGWDARVVQHEVDHLDGVLIVDYARSSTEKIP